MFTITESHSLLELAARATVLLAVALALAWFTRRGPARVRHLLWTTTFALLLGLPALNLLGPAWEVPLLPALTRDTPVVQPPMPVPAGPTARTATGDISLPPPTLPSPDPTPSATPAAEPPSPMPSIPLPLLLWGIGCAAALTSLLAGRLRFDRLVRQAQPVDDPIWLRHVDMVRALLGIQGKVRLYLSPRATTPMTGGLWRPAILLPASAAKWSGGRRRAVLTHELIHVRRRDAFRQLVVRAALALYWFHPLAWVAARLAASAREEACDQEVLALGARPSQYARHLLAVAGGMSPGPSVLSLPMVRHSGSRLEQRIVSILEPNRPRASTIVTALVLTAIGGVGVSASMTHPVRFLSGGTTKVRIVDNHFREIPSSPGVGGKAACRCSTRRENSVASCVRRGPRSICCCSVTSLRRPARIPIPSSAAVWRWGSGVICSSSARPTATRSGLRERRHPGPNCPP